MLVTVSHAQTCEDVNSAICQDMFSLDPNLCTKSCFYSTLCPRFCGKCPLKCYSCHEVDNPDLCYTTAQCPSADHFCIVTQSFNDDFKDVYKLGCALNTVCTSHFGPGIGKRYSSLSERSELQGSCCGTDLCNVKNRNVTTPVVPVTTLPPTMAPTTTKSLSVSIYPDIPRDSPDDDTNTTMSPTSSLAPMTSAPIVMTSAPVVTSGLCHDIDESICNRLETHFPNMCSVDCIANEVCPRKCGKCMGCYQCSHVTNPEDCTRKTVCGKGEKCFSVETISANFEQGFKLGCMDERLCSTFVHAAPGIFGKRQGFELSLHGGCCKGEFCNHHSILPFSSAPSTVIPTAAQTIVHTTAGPSCSSHYTTCPPGWRQHHRSCYALGTPAMSWSSAKAQCEKNCGVLADFSSSSDVNSVVQDLRQHLSSLSSTANLYVWVGAKLSHSIWSWSTTGQTADHSLQHNNGYHNDYCGYIILSSSRASYLHPQLCSKHYLPLCEIKNVRSA